MRMLLASMISLMAIGMNTFVLLLMGPVWYVTKNTVNGTVGSTLTGQAAIAWSNAGQVLNWQLPAISLIIDLGVIGWWFMNAQARDYESFSY